MTPWRDGFICGAVLAIGTMLALPVYFERDARDGWDQSHLAQVIAIGGGRAEPQDADFLMTHWEPYVNPMAVARYESHNYLPRGFVVETRGRARDMIADGPICPIVILATPDEIRISPCLARVGAR